MPVHGPRSPEDWEKADLSGGVHFDLEGGLVNTPDNHVADADLQEVTPDGGTRTMRLLKGLSLDGNAIYSTPPGGKNADLVKQTGEPIRPEERLHVSNEPIVEVGPRPLTPYDPNLPQLRLVVQNLADNKRGFPGGDYLAALLIEDAAGNPTTALTPTAFSIANGQDLEWTPPAEISPGGKRWSLLVTEPPKVPGAAPNPATLRVQDRARPGVGPRRVPGPYDYKGDKKPTRNETFLGRPPAPRWNADMSLRRAPNDMAEADIAAAYVLTTPRGDSLVSHHSTQRRFRADEDHALMCRLRKPDPAATGIKWFFRIDGAWYRLVRSGRVYADRQSPLDEAVPCYAVVTADDGVVDPGKTQKTGGWALVPAELPTEDTSGVEAPTGEMDPPRGIGPSRPPAGRYRKTYAPVRGGVEQRAAVPSVEEITDSQMLLCEIPNPVNRWSNPEASLRGADGQPLFLAANTSNGRLADDVGKPGVATSGLVNEAVPTATPYRELGPVPAEPDLVETVAGTLEVSGYAAASLGSGRHVLVQTKADGTTSQTVLAERSSNGSTEYRKTLGPAGSGAEIVKVEGVTELRLRIGCSATSGRNMTVRGRDLLLYPGEGAPWKFAFPPEGAAQIADPDAPPEMPFYPGPVACVTRPRSSGAPVGFEPVEVLDPAETPNPATAGWQANKTNNPNSSLGFFDDPALGPCYRAVSEATGSRDHAYYSKTYGVGSAADQVNGSSLGVRQPFRFPRFPTRSPNEVVFFSVHDPQDNYLAFPVATNDGRLILVARSRQGKDRRIVALSGLTPDDELDVELIPGGGNTADGRVSLLVGLNGERRQEVASFDDIDWIGRRPVQVRFLVSHEKDSAGRWEVLAGKLRVTQSGDVENETDAGAEARPPDRPTGADGGFREIDADGVPKNLLYVHVPPGFSGTEVGAVFDDFALKPGKPETLAAYRRFEGLEAQAAPTLSLSLLNGAGGIEEHAALPPALSGSAGWDEATAPEFSPPPGFYRARLAVKRSEPGLLLVAEPLVSDGGLATRVARDARRTKLVAEGGTFAALLSGRIPTPRATRSAGFDETWIRLTLVAEIPDGAGASALYLAGDDPDALLPQGGTPDPAAVIPDARHAAILGTLSATDDRREGPRVPPGGASLVYRTAVSTLLKADRSPLPGGSVVTKIDRAYQGRNYRTNPEGEEAKPAGITNPVGRLDGFHVSFFDPDAVAWFKENMLEGEITVEHVAANAIYRARLFEYAEADPYDSELPEEIIGYVWTTFRVGRSHVIEVGVLDPALGGLR